MPQHPPSDCGHSPPVGTWLAWHPTQLPACVSDPVPARDAVPGFEALRLPTTTTTTPPPPPRIASYSAGHSRKHPHTESWEEPGELPVWPPNKTLTFTMSSDTPFMAHRKYQLSSCHTWSHQLWLRGREVWATPGGVNYFLALGPLLARSGDGDGLYTELGTEPGSAATCKAGVLPTVPSLWFCQPLY